MSSNQGISSHKKSQDNDKSSITQEDCVSKYCSDNSQLKSKNDQTSENHSDTGDRSSSKAPTIENKKQEEQKSETVSEEVENKSFEEQVMVVKIKHMKIPSEDLYCRVMLDEAKWKFRYVFTNQLSEKTPIYKELVIENENHKQITQKITKLVKSITLRSSSGKDMFLFRPNKILPFQFMSTVICLCILIYVSIVKFEDDEEEKRESSIVRSQTVHV